MTVSKDASSPMSLALTGEGILSAIGFGKSETRASLLSRRSGIGEMRHLHSSHRELPVGEVPMGDDEMKAMLGIEGSREVSRTVLMGILAIRQALQDAGIKEKSGRRIVLVDGTTVGGMDVTERHYNGMLSGNADDIEALRNHDCGSATRQMAEYFGIFDDFATVSTACSSAANALVLAAGLIRSGEADIVVAGGSEALTRFHLNGFNSLMILDKRPCRPFDDTRAGLNLGEGAAFVVMESGESAKNRGAETHAFLTGYGNACDAYHQTASSENGEGAYLAMTQALKVSGLRPSDIDYVNAHGTGTPDNDAAESAALRRVFSGNVPPFSSTKGLTGHTTSASGGIEAVICLIAMEGGFTPANAGFSVPIPGGLTPTMGCSGIEIRNVMCNSFGFGGNDTSLVFSKSAAGWDGPYLRYEESDISIVASSDIKSEDELSGISRYVKPLEARRMGKLMRGAMLTSLRALEEAGIDCPDAIICATGYGCLENSERLLDAIELGGEGLLSPTLFMQSTHNTIAGALAIKTGCHGYNSTYSQGGRSLEWALKDARLLLRSGACRTVLVCRVDETTPAFSRLLDRLGAKERKSLDVSTIILSCGR